MGELCSGSWELIILESGRRGRAVSHQWHPTSREDVLGLSASLVSLSIPCDLRLGLVWCYRGTSSVEHSP